ncbi:MAG: patatin-like phospholipase family protein [Pseudomonadota bacterium]|nr:patatin-like phospholipase family protein [Pseudomonadota bacterium]
MIPNDSRDALVLPGGGARGAYQVGVLKAISDILPKHSSNPFPLISGTSAGAINSVVLASRARFFASAVKEMEFVWRNFRSNQVFKSDSLTLSTNSIRWLLTFLSGGMGKNNPVSLLDNSPLRQLLIKQINFSNIQEAINKGYLRGVSVTAAGYRSARSVSFYQGEADLKPWDKLRHKGKSKELNINHLMASIAVPIVFPSIMLAGEYFGDGAMRQATPLSPAINLGANRIFVIGARNEKQNTLLPNEEDPNYPSLGVIAGYMLDALFLDGLTSDLAHLIRINLLLENISGQHFDSNVNGPRRIETVVILPSEDIRDIAARHVHELPKPVRFLLNGIGALNKDSMQLASYLLFESSFTSELIDLGYSDAMSRKFDLESFFSGQPINTFGGISGWSNFSEE